MIDLMVHVGILGVALVVGIIVFFAAFMLGHFGHAFVTGWQRGAGNRTRGEQ